MCYYVFCCQLYMLVSCAAKFRVNVSPKCGCFFSWVAAAANICLVLTIYICFSITGMLRKYVHVCGCYLMFLMLHFADYLLSSFVYNLPNRHVKYASTYVCVNVYVCVRLCTGFGCFNSMMLILFLFFHFCLYRDDEDSTLKNHYSLQSHYSCSHMEGSQVTEINILTLFTFVPTP